jgi:hypothetical protein
MFLKKLFIKFRHIISILYTTQYKLRLSYNSLIDLSTRTSSKPLPASRPWGATHTLDLRLPVSIAGQKSVKALNR